MAKKFINKNVFLCHKKELNWQIIIKNLVAFLKDGMKSRIKYFNIMGDH